MVRLWIQIYISERQVTEQKIKLTIIPRVRVGYEMVDKNHRISNKRECDNCLIKNALKISRILPVLICKNNRFSACVFTYWADTYSYHIWRTWLTITAHIQYPMIQFLKKGNINSLVSSEIVMASIYRMFNSLS